MILEFLINEKKIFIETYKTYQEKDILLLLSFDIFDFNQVLDILNFKKNNDIDYTELTENEKRVLLFKYREISVGDEVDIRFKCECGVLNENKIEAANFIIDAISNDSDIKKLSTIITDDNINLFLKESIDIDELDIIEFENLKQRIMDNQISFNFIKSTKCIKCGKIRMFDLSEPKYIIEIMSDDDLMTLYKIYHNLIYFGKHNLKGIDEMYPFERSIYVSLLNKTQKDLAE